MARGSTHRFLNFIAFIAMIAVGIALFIGWLFPNMGQLPAALQVIANVLAYVVVGFYAFIYARNKSGKNAIWYMVAWAVSAVLILIAQFPR